MRAAQLRRPPFTIMLELHLYGKLRRYADESNPTSESIRRLAYLDGDTVGSVIDRIGIPPDDLGSNMFVNGRYADRSSPLLDGDRVGLFPDNMQLLYKWYFAPRTDSGAPRTDSGVPQEPVAMPDQDSTAPDREDQK